MLQHNLGYAAKTARCVNATVAGTTTINGASVDRLGFESVRFTCLLGALTATQVTSLKAQGSNDNAAWVDLASTNTGPAADGDSNKMLQLDIYRPNYRYVRPVVLRATANAAIDGVIADLYLAAAEPVSTDATMSALNVQAYVFTGTP